MNDEYLVAAANWWTEQLRVAPGHQETGNTTINTVRTIGARQVYTPLSQDQLDYFHDALLGSLREKEDAYFHFGVDYDADDILAAALYEGHIVDGRDWVEDERLPTKTIMWIDENGVTVKRGYGASIETVYPIAPPPPA